MRYDVVIVGSGAGGGPLALRLSQARMNVLVLEKGPRFDPDDYVHDPLVITHGVFTPSIDNDPHTVVTPKTRSPQRTTLGWVASCVGGGTSHMGAYFFRFHPRDFRMGSAYGERYGLADWPFDYDALEPFYCEAEQEVGVSGAGGANPFEGARSAPYPLAPLESHPIAETLGDVCAARGLTAFPTPRAINSAAYRGRPACSYCETCAGYGCPTNARGSTQAALLPRAEATGSCRVETNAMVREILVGPHGAKGCVYINEAGQEIEVEAGVVCICASSIESARLLLLSKSPRHPDGLGNNHGLVGRNLQFHAVTMGFGDIPRANIKEGAFSSPFIGRSLMDYYFLPPGVCDFAKGGIIRFDFDRQLPNEDVAQCDVSAKRIHFEAFHDYLSTDGNYIELDDTVTDRWGLPVARIHLDPHPFHREIGAWLGARAADLLYDLGASSVKLTDIGATSSYLVMGTCRAGRDPANSVLDVNCELHETPGVYVVDGSFMPTSAGAPPTLTILANSFRIARYIAAINR